MGDRVWVNVTTAAALQDKFEEGLCPPTEELKYGVDPSASPLTEVEGELVELGFEEMNYAAYDELKKLAAQGIPFHGWHNVGGDYPAMVFASDGEKVHYAPTLDDWDGPVCAMNPDGTIDPSCRKDASLYFKALDAAKHQLQIHVKTGTCGWLEEGEKRTKKKTEDEELESQEQAQTRELISDLKADSRFRR